MPRRPDGQLDVGAVLDANDFFARLEWLRPVRRQISGRIGQVDRLDEQVLHVGVRGREAPGDRVVLTQNDDRTPGERAPLDRSFRRDNPREIPDDRRAKAEVRVVREDRLAGNRSRSGHHPFVRRALSD